jgi:hypothetical protein
VVPLFFLLSGLSLSVVYGERTWPNGQSPCCGEAQIAGGGDPEAPSSKTQARPPNYYAFLQNRLARIMPVYYACTLLALPVFLAGYCGIDPRNLGAIIGSIVTTVFAQNTMLLMLLGYGAPIAGPSWTVGTLMW